MLVLDVDIGNTRSKWRCGEQHGVLANNEKWLPSLVEIAVKPQRVRVANVAGAQVERDLADCVASLWGLPLEVAATSSCACGIHCGYPDPSQLGVDRWLAILAASQRVAGSAVVVSAGSAITVDLLSVAQGHLGGYIVPGLEMQRRALFAGTSQVKVTAGWQGAGLDPGNDTAGAVLGGCLKMAVALIERCRDELDKNATVLLSGGDSEHLRHHLCGKVIVAPELVLDGLAVLMP